MKISIKKLLKKYLSPILSIILAIGISIAVFIFKDKLANLEHFGYLGLFFLSILGNATIILPVPIILTAFLGGAIFNPVMVGIVISLGATIGELTGYLAGLGGGELIENDPKVQKVKKWMDKYGLWTLFALAVIPNPLFDIAGILAGAARVKIYKYMTVVWAGKFIKFLLISLLGSGSATALGRLSS